MSGSFGRRMKKKIALEDAPSERKLTPKKLRWRHKGRSLAVVAGFLLLVLVPLRAAQADLNPPLPELLQKLHDLYLDKYQLFAEAFSRAIKLPAKTAYGEELKTNINLCKVYQDTIVDYSARLERKVAPISSDRAEQKKTINELIWLEGQLADANRFLVEVLLKLSLETGLNWRDQFENLKSESVFYQGVLMHRIQQLISSTF
jgi:hypothetical protein